EVLVGQLRLVGLETGQDVDAMRQGAGELGVALTGGTHAPRSARWSRTSTRATSCASRGAMRPSSSPALRREAGKPQLNTRTWPSIGRRNGTAPACTPQRQSPPDRQSH